MAKGGGSTRTVSANNASASRTNNISGLVKTFDEANKVMETYKNLYNMPSKEQKAFTDSFAQAMIDTFNQKKDIYEKEYFEKTNKAFKEKDKALYDNATSVYQERVRLLVEERDNLTAMYNRFIRVKK